MPVIFTPGGSVALVGLDGQNAPLACPLCTTRWARPPPTPASPLFAIPTLLRLEGPLAIDILQRSLTELTRRHRILSAVVSERAGEPALVAQPPARFALPVVDLQDLSTSQHDVTLFMVLLAGINALLYRYCGQSDLRVGAVVANRNRPETERLIGLLANTVILRTEVSGGLTGRELLRRVRRTTLEAYAHQELPFEVLLEQLRSRHDLAHEAPFQVLLVFHSNPVRPAQAADLHIRPAP